MKETRVQKWKTYRDSLIKQEAQIVEPVGGIRDIEVKRSPKVESSTISATSTLPIAEVIKGINEEETNEKQKRNLKPIIQVAIVAIIALGVVTGLVFLGIWAFRGQ